MKKVKLIVSLIAIPLVVMFIALPCSAAKRQNGKVPSNSSTWRSLIRSITPFSVEMTVFLKTDSAKTERLSHVYVEFLDTRHVYQRAEFSIPLPLEYMAFSRGDNVLIHDIKNGDFSFIPSRMTPIPVSTLDQSAESFLDEMKFDAMEPEILDNRKAYVLKITCPPMEVTPWNSLEEVRGHLWIDAANGKPLKMILTGTMEIDSGKSPASAMVEFRYSRPLLGAGQWKQISKALAAFDKGRNQYGEQIVKNIEKGMMPAIPYGMPTK